MTLRNLYEAVLIEINKEDSPNILLEDFNYFANKSVYQYINKRYNIYDINQQTTDDLRVLKSTVRYKKEDIKKVNLYDDLSLASQAVSEIVLPSDYLHILNCICVYNVKKTYKCYDKGDKWRCAAKKLTSDSYSNIMDNFWTSPSYKRPYYYIHNVNTNLENPTNPYDEDVPGSTDINIPLNSSTTPICVTKHTLTYNNVSEFNDNISTDLNNLSSEMVNEEGVLVIIKGYNDTVYIYNETTDPEAPVWSISTIIEGDCIDVEVSTGSNVRYFYTKKGNFLKFIPEQFTSINVFEKTQSNVERSAKVRYGNASQVRMEIRYGTDTSVFELDSVLIDYIKTPQYLRLTQKQLDQTEDHSQVLEYPDYVCQEIINELVHVLMENQANQRLQTHPVVSQSIANPTQTQTPEAAG